MTPGNRRNAVVLIPAGEILKDERKESMIRPLSSGKGLRLSTKMHLTLCVKCIFVDSLKLGIVPVY